MLTHDAPSRFLDFTSLAVGESNRLHLFLDKVLLKLTYEKWFFGCYHKDVQLSTKSRCVCFVMSSPWANATRSGKKEKVPMTFRPVVYIIKKTKKIVNTLLGSPINSRKPPLTV